jgi:hypothetical protein
MTCTHPANNEAGAKELGNEIFDRNNGKLLDAALDIRNLQKTVSNIQ